MPGGLKNFGLRVQGLSYYSPPELDGIWLWLLYSHKTPPHIFHILSTEGGLYLNFGTLSPKGRLKIEPKHFGSTLGGGP